MMSKSRIPSPSRSQGAVTPRRNKPRRTLSVTSAKSDASGRLTSVVEQYIKDDKFKMSPLRRKSILPDDTDIEAPRRASWWKRLDSSSRDVLEALDTNRMPEELLLEDYEFEVQKDKQNQSVPESSDNESVASIIVPQRRLFNQKKQQQGKFGDIMASRKSLGKTTLEDQDKTIHSVPKNLFKQGQPRNRPVFPAALINSTNKTINKTVEPEPESNKQGRNLFGQGTKRKKNMFTDFVLSESEDDSEVQHKVFGFKKNDKRMSLATRNRRMPSLTPSVTTDIDIDDWNLLPSSTMIGNGSIAMEVSGVITDKDIELAQDENRDVTVTEPNESLELESNKQNTSKNKQSLRRSTFIKSKIQSDISDKTNDKVSETKTVEQAQDHDQDATLTESHESLKPESLTSENPKRQTLTRSRLSKSRKLSDEYNNTLGNEKLLESITTKQAPSNKIDVTLLESNDSLKSDSVSRNASENPKRQTLIQSRLSKSRKLSDDNNEALGDKNNFESETTEQAASDDRNATLPEANVSLKSESVRRNTRENSKRQTLNHSGLSESKKLSDDSNETHGNKNVLESITSDHAQNNNRDISLTEPNESLKPGSYRQNASEIAKKVSLNRTGQNKSKKMSEENKTFDDENIVGPVAFEQTRDDNQLAALEANKSSKPGSDKHDTSRNLKQFLNRTELSKSKKLSSAFNKTPAEANILESKTPDAHNDNEDVNKQATGYESSVEDQMAELHGVSGNNNKSEQDTEPSVDQQSDISAKETSKEDPNEDMEEMVWNDDDKDNKNDTTQEESEQEDKEDNESDPDNDENIENDQEDEDVQSEQEHDADVEINQDINEQELSDQVTPTKDIPNKSQKIVESSIEEEQMEQENEAIDVTPNATNDTTGRNRIKDAIEVKSPESVLKNMSRDNMSFKPIGRSTSFRRSKSPTENIISRPTLIPIQESIIGSDGSRNSSTEGSGWDSHRTTRKTLRQTFGKDFTPRKSLRTLVMEKSAKRQTEVSKNTSKINKTRNKTVLEEPGKTVTRVNETANKTVLEDIRDRRVSNRNLSSDQLPGTKSPAPGVSAHHVSDPNISKPRISYHKSVQEINELGSSPQISDRLEPDQGIDDSGPEISIHASYGHGMSGDASDQDDDHSFVKNPQTTSEQRKSVKKSMPLETDHDIQEALDYDPSLREEMTHEESSKEISEREKSDQQGSSVEVSDTKAQDVSDHENEKEDSELKESLQNVEAQESNQEDDAQESEPELEMEESEHEESQRMSEPDSEHENSEQSIQDVEAQESNQEDDAQESEPGVEIDQSEHEESQQMSEPNSEHEDSEEERESEQEEQELSQQEIEPESEQENREHSQQEIESEYEEQDGSQQEVELSEREQSHESINDNSQQHSDQESNKEMDSDSEQDNGISDNDHVDAEREQNSKRFTERVVFDNELSDQEIDYDLSERVSRHITDNEISEQVSDVEMEDRSISRGSVHDNHDVSIGTKKSLLLMQMQKIAQENMELRQKIREKVEKSLKRKRDCNPLMSPMQPKIFSSMRRMNKPEPKKPKIQPRKTTTITIGTLPKEFVDDLKYKPPKRFQPANAPWITKRLYKFLETKLEPKYDYRARIRAEELVQSIYGFTKQARRRDVAPQDAVDELKREMARLNVVSTHFDFYEFFHEFMPREIRIKVNPDIVNKIPMPRNGIFADILQSRPVVDG